MNQFTFFCLLLPALVASQSLVLIGGGLSDGNAAVWDKMVELAVSNVSIKLKNCKISSLWS